MDDIERAAAFKIINTFKNAPELKLDSTQFKPDDEFEEGNQDIKPPERENPAGT